MLTGNTAKSGANPSWIDALILIACIIFVLVLALSAAFEPSIRLLHTFQALIYIAVVPMTRRQNSWGFGAAVLIATFWNYTNLFVTNFISSGVEQLTALVHTGHMPHPELLIAVFAAASHFLLIWAALVGFLRLRPNFAAWAKFLAGGILTIAYFIACIFLIGRQYIPLVHRIFHLSTSA